MVYHGYENGFRTLGRQTLLDPIEWTPDGWPESKGGDLSRPLPMPTGRSGGPHGMPRSDDFSKLAFGTRWTFYGAAPDEVGRAHLDGNALVMRAGVEAERACPHQTVVARTDQRGNGTCRKCGPELLFFNDRLYLGMEHGGQRMTTYRGGKPSY
jgi:xylan 1,4-beta-xylosidase